MTNNKAEWFEYKHLPEHLQGASKLFYELAEAMEAMCPTNSAELTIAFNKLIESKDWFVRAYIKHLKTING